MKIVAEANGLTQALRSIIPHKNIVFLCVGTDRSTGDSFGPLVGMYLQERGLDVIGTLDDPVHAMNLDEKLSEIPPGKFVIAVDACLGKPSSVGKYIISDGPLKPGAGVGKDLPAVGDASIAAVVNVGGFMEYFVLQNTRLSHVMQLAKNMADSVCEIYDALEDEEHEEAVPCFSYLDYLCIGWL